MTLSTLARHLAYASSARLESLATRLWRYADSIPDELEELRRERDALLEEVDALRGRAESAELGCELVYQREPTQSEGDAHDPRGTGECYVAMGGWTGRRCRVCGQWSWGGPTACARCVEREDRDEARAEVARLTDSLRAIDARLTQWNAVDSDGHSGSRRLSDALSALYHLTMMRGQDTPALPSAAAESEALCG